MTVPASYGCYKIIGGNAYEMPSAETSTYKGPKHVNEYC